KFYHEENILENQIIHFSLPFCHARFLKSTNFTLSSLVLALFLSSNMAYAKNTAYGSGAEAVGDSSTAYGENSQAGRTRSTAVGNGSYAGTDYSTALGANARSGGTSSTAVGEAAHAGGGIQHSHRLRCSGYRRQKHCNR
ncbi:hypothetical protein AVM50_23700, partial [Salmonella enterica]|nr:hypothetical protein [Salmonella enterica]